MLSPLDRQNIRQLENLNQRGGRMLTVVDLIDAGTLSIDMAAAVMEALANGSSILTGARPGGAGKTTVLAAFLNLLPPDVVITTVDEPLMIQRALDRPPQQPTCYLVHEIGAGHWYGYLWGRPVADYFRLITGPHRIASCLHADTLEELTDILLGPPLHVNAADLDRVGILGFMRMDSLGRGHVQRRLATLCIRSPYLDQPCRFVFNVQENSFSRQPWPIGVADISSDQPAFRGDSTTLARENSKKGVYFGFIEHLMHVGARSLDQVREEVVAFYKRRHE